MQTEYQQIQNSPLSFAASPYISATLHLYFYNLSKKKDIFPTLLIIFFNTNPPYTVIFIYFFLFIVHLKLFFFVYFRSPESPWMVFLMRSSMVVNHWSKRDTESNSLTASVNASLFCSSWASRSF